MTHLRVRALGALGVLLLLPVAAAGQAPGYQQLDVRSIRAEYTAEVLDRINDLLLEWGEAWANDRPDELAEYYWEDALLIPPEGGLHRGRDEIQAYFEETLATHGSVEAFMLDFDASGGMSQVFGNYMLQMQQGPEAGSRKSGPLITIYVQRGRSWRIRSQVFLPPQ